MATILVVQPAAAYDRTACPVTEKRSTRRKSIAIMSLLPVRWWSGWRNILVFARNRSQQSFCDTPGRAPYAQLGALLRALTPQRWPGLFLISSMVDAEWSIPIGLARRLPVLQRQFRPSCRHGRMRRSACRFTAILCPPIFNVLPMSFFQPIQFKKACSMRGYGANRERPSHPVVLRHRKV